MNRAQRRAALERQLSELRAELSELRSAAGRLADAHNQTVKILEPWTARVDTRLGELEGRRLVLP